MKSFFFVFVTGLIMERRSSRNPTPASTPANSPTPAASKKLKTIQSSSTTSTSSTSALKLSEIGKISNVYQFKLTLEERREHKEPRMWRRVLIPEDYTFYEFHQAILDCMDLGNCDCDHTHEFMMEDTKRPRAFYLDDKNKICPNPGFDEYFKGKPPAVFKDGDNEELQDRGWISNTNNDETRYCTRDIKIADHFKHPCLRAAYCFDHIACWDIEVELEDILKATPNVEYPKIVDGQICSPPEHGTDLDWEEFKRTCRNFNFKTVKFQRATRRMNVK